MSALLVVALRSRLTIRSSADISQSVAVYDKIRWQCKIYTNGMTMRDWKREPVWTSWSPLFR